MIIDLNYKVQLIDDLIAENCTTSIAEYIDTITEISNIKEATERYELFRSSISKQQHFNENVLFVKGSGRAGCI